MITYKKEWPIELVLKPLRSLVNELLIAETFDQNIIAFILQKNYISA